MPLADERALRRIATAIEGVTYTPSSSIAARLEGQAFTYRLTTRGADSGAEPWTEIELVVEPSSIELELRPQDAREESLVRRGAALDVSLGDAAFDGAFIVEGAPSEAIRKWLVPDVRARLVGLAPVCVTLRGKILVVAKRAWVCDPAEARALAEIGCALANQYARVVLTRRDDALASASASARQDGNRDALSPESARIALERAERIERAEIAHLRTIRHGRAARQRVITITLGVAIVLTLASAIAVFVTR